MASCVKSGADVLGQDNLAVCLVPALALALALAHCKAAIVSACQLSRGINLALLRALCTKHDASGLALQCCRY